MFAEKAFIESSRQFVCLRLETYESEENQQLVRKFLNGKLVNTTFVVLSPDGKKQLCRASRSPSMSFGNRGDSEKEILDDVLEAMHDLADGYATRGSIRAASVPDFYSFGQALNVSSADQRLLVYTVAPEVKRERAKQALQELANDPNMRGKFHFDFAERGDAEWQKQVAGSNARTGIFIIRAGEFGLKGEVLAHFPLGTPIPSIRSQLMRLNAEFAATEKPKDHGAHIATARRKGIDYTNVIPHGEDRDGDENIDNLGRGR